MPSLFIYVKDIHPQHKLRGIRVRCVRIYDVPEKRGGVNIKSMECLFHDDQGHYIHANIQAKDVVKYKEVLEEGQLYEIKNFYAITNYYLYKVTQHKYMLKFNYKTEVKHINSIGFPLFMFRLRSFESLKDPNEVNDKELIGRVVEIYSPVDKVVGGKATKFIDFQICDNEAKLVSGGVRITSSYDVTKLWFNSDFDEFKDFRSQLKVQETPIESLSTMTLNSQSTGIDSFQKGERIVSTIFDLYKLQDGDYYVPAEIVAIEALRGDWYYMACMTPGCNKKLRKINGVLRCEKCEKPFEEGTTRYKVLVRALDKTTDAPFLLWDWEVSELVGIPATLLYDKYKELEVLIGLKMVFKLGIKRSQMKGSNPAFNVMRVLRDEELLSAYCARLFEDQDKDLMSQQIEEEENTSEYSDEASKEEEVNSHTTTQAKQSQVNAKPDSPTTKRSLLDQFSSSKREQKVKEGSH
ncbi:PREDICTED: replication protein A 70 kDa DNA-binding subunit-like [Ipomoea nil]|uniref:replication protein A 70 kDa DNA-binding subunit-like n=1 Tax=Ipomoea nil TaxID=35883 RepID=UPI0009015D83|nr:PREDICTED: replication protein A 70 kDa DNA-binding subunit-like [Ipomoea nil]